MKTSNPPPVNVQAHSRFMKLLFFVMVSSVGLYAVVLKFVGQSPTPLPDGVRTGTKVCALASALLVLFVRFVKIAAVLVPDMPIPAAERLAKLRTYFIVCYVFSESVALYGFVLRFLGSNIQEVVPFFVGSLFIYALCYPRLPSDMEEDER